MHGQLSFVVLTLAGVGSAAIRPLMQYQGDLRLLGETGEVVPFFEQQANGVSAMKIGIPTINKIATPVVDAKTVTLPLDHFGGDPGTFENRYWVGEQDYIPGHPIFIYDVGEANADPYVPARLQNNTSFFKQMLQQFGGMGIVWEHRYYGESTHVPINLETPSTAFKWLTTEQSLADVVTFAQNFSRPNFPNLDLTPKGTPWIFVGGSYPGMRAAFMRELYPDTIYASWACSAPVEAQVDMSIYFEQVYRGMNAYGWGNCTKDINAAIKYMDKLMQNDTAAALLKNQFLGPGGETNSNAGFADALTTIFYEWQSFGVEGILRPFCDFIETDPKTAATAPADGWAASKGAKYVVDRWADWPQFIDVVNQFTPANCSKTGTKETADCHMDIRFPDPSSISWMWQYCTQWGFFQSANKGPNQIVSSWNSLQHQADICHRQFPDGKASGLLPDLPDVHTTNRHLGGWRIRPSNTYWSNGMYDPWRTLSPMSEEKFAPDHIRYTQNVPRCNVETGSGTLFGSLVPDAEHCFDFRMSFLPGKPSRDLWNQALREWLPCFKKS